jgi:hypothetical protein
VVDLGHRYLELVLRLHALAPGLVEGYTGPPQLAASVDAEPSWAAGELAEQARAVGQLVSEQVPEEDRRRWLLAQLAAISTVLDWLAGGQLSYPELVERCHGVRAMPVPDEQFELAHRNLDGALPGTGDVRERYRSWAATQLVPRELLLPGISAVCGELRRRTDGLFDLPAGEEASFELVTGKRYAGNADPSGGLHTRVTINADLPITSTFLVELVSHEAYPGHHTEYACKQARLVTARGRIELCVYLYPSPQALLAEGIACHGLELLLGNEAEELGAACLRPLGIPYDVQIAGVVREAQQLLRGVRTNLAMMLDEQQLPAEQARAYARQWLLEGDQQADRDVNNLQARVWRPYESCYTAGLEYCRRHTQGDPARFRELLHEQITPHNGP